MNLRQLKKQDKRAAVVMLALHRGAASPNGFRLSDDGRYSYEWRCCFDDDVLDRQPALDYLREIESLEHMTDCFDPKTGAYLSDDQRPPSKPSAMHKLPAGWRWRGGRLVPVDKRGAMVRQKENP